MCYMLYLSTDSPENLAKNNSDRVRFAQIGDDEERAMSLLQSQKWYVGSKSGCSCNFRHLASTDLGFGERVDWYPEEGEDILATAELYKVILRLVSEGNQVDCLDIWDGHERGEVKSLVVNLKVVPKEDFRFFENHHFVFEG